MITILIVEDCAQERELYRKAVSGLENIQVLETESGEAALQLLEKQRVDMFLMDVELPGMNGFQLAQLIRMYPEYAFAPILFVTGYSKNPLDAFREFHCYDYIIKPFDLKEFTARIQEVISRLQKIPKQPSEKHKLVLFHTRSGDVFCLTKDIRFVEMNWKGCYAQMEKNTIPLLNTSLTKVIQEVDEDFFVQCHKSFAINVLHITRVEKVNYRFWRVYLSGCDQPVDMTAKYKPMVEEATRHYCEITARSQIKVKFD